MQVGFPQKSTFGALTATSIVCPSIDSGAVDLLLKRDGGTMLRLANGYIRLDSHSRLMTDKELQDASGATILASDNAGKIDQLATITPAVTLETSIAVPAIITPIVQSAAATLLLRLGAVAKMTIGSTYVRPEENLTLAAGKYLRDNAGNVLLDTDDVGNISGLARIDDAVKTPATSHYIASSIGPLISPAQSGTITEGSGKWSTDVDDILYVFLGALMGRVQLNATVHIDSVKIAYKTEHNDAYVDYGRVYRNSLIGVSTVLIGDNSVNNGDGDQVQDVFTISVDAAMVANFDYYIEIKAEATAGTVAIYGIEVAYHTT